MAKKTSSRNTFICFVLDKSGSMSSQTDRAIAGFNEFLEEQKKVKDKATITLVLFDTNVTKVYVNKALEDAEKLSRATYAPSGWTALYDAVGQTVKAIESKVTEKDRVVITIFTDGQENSSQEYNQDTIRKIITEKEASGNWTFAFMGVDKDAWIVGQKLGMQKGNIASIDFKDVSNSVRISARAVAAYRSTNNAQVKTLYNTTSDTNT